jgi:DNA-binding CsgD family transcriptional regulator
MGILMTRYRYQLGRDQAFDLLRIASQLGGRSLGPIRRNPTNPLTERQLQVLLGVSDGESNAEIGRDLFLATDTVKTHTRRIFRKLWVTDRGATTPSTAPKINRTTPVTASPSVASPRRRQVGATPSRPASRAFLARLARAPTCSQRSDHSGPRRSGAGQRAALRRGGKLDVSGRLPVGGAVDQVRAGRAHHTAQRLRRLLAAHQMPPRRKTEISLRRFR